MIYSSLFLYRIEPPLYIGHYPGTRTGAPIVVGSGKRLFEEGSDQRALQLVESKTFSTGVLYLSYQPAQS